MTDREFIEKLKAYLTYEQNVAVGMTPAQHRDALAEQIGEAWQACDNYLDGKPVKLTGVG